MRNRGPMEFRVIAAVALIGIAAFSPAALAQEAPIASSVELGDLFGGEDSVNLTQEKASELIRAARQARAPGGCPLGALYIVTPEGDRLFQDAMASARRAAVLSLLNNAGIDVSRFFVDSMVEGTENNAWLSNNLDRERPTLATTSVPAKGSRVEAGDQITVTMVGRDDADPAHWQTGIKTLQLIAESEGGAFVASENYEACAEGPPPPQRRVVATYIVPENPPPVVRLTALAEDHTGLIDTDAAEFPTQGDWYGRLVWSYHGKEDTSRRPNENRAETKFDGYADLTVTYDGQGNLTGTLVGSQKVDTLWWGYPHGSGEMCKGSAPPTPVRARVVGSHTPGRNALSLQLVDVEAQIVVPWTLTGGGSYLDCSPFPIDNGPSISGMVGALQPVGDGSYRAEYQSVGPEVEYRHSLILRPVTE